MHIILIRNIYLPSSVGYRGSITPYIFRLDGSKAYKMKYQQTSKGYCLLHIDRRIFAPLTIPNYSLVIYMCMQNLKKIHKNLIMLESENKALTDG